MFTPHLLFLPICRTLHCRVLPSVSSAIHSYVKKNCTLLAVPPLSHSSACQCSHTSELLEPEAYDIADRRKWVMENISNSLDDSTRMLFAVIYIQEKQYKVTQDDLIHVERNIPLDVGEEIILEKLLKVLMVGSTEFTLIGRPLLDPKFVQVRATVIEKTTTSPEVKYDPRRKSVKNPIWLSHELSIIRINHIRLDKMLLGGLK